MYGQKNLNVYLQGRQDRRIRSGGNRQALRPTGGEQLQPFGKLFYLRRLEAEGLLGQERGKSHPLCYFRGSGRR